MSAVAQRALERLAHGDRDGAIAALSCASDCADLAVLGMAYLDAGHWGSAYGTLRHAVASGDAMATTMLNLSLAEDRLGLDGRTRMRAVMADNPDWDEPPLRLAESLRRAGEPHAAIQYYERTLDLHPSRFEALLGLGTLLIGHGDNLRAQVLLVQCCGVSPRSAEAWDALGIALLASGEAGPAEAAFAVSFRLHPGNEGVALRRVEAAIDAGTSGAELARLEMATHQDPLDIAQLTARGVLLDRIGRPDDAADILEAVVALAPDSPRAAAALATSQLHAGQFGPAVPSLRRAVRLAPDNVALQNDLAAALNRVHRYREGRAILEELIAEHGDRPALLCNLCNSLVSLGLQREGVEVARRATGLAPEGNLGWRTLANALAYDDGTTADELLHVCRQAGATLPRGAASGPPQPTDPERRLRIGLLSANLRTHPVGWLTIAGFEALDPAGFDLVCFGQAPSADPMQRRFQTIASAWNTITSQSPQQIAEAIRASRIDVLIDLGGWGDLGMLGVCAQRPAPVQMKWVGTQNHSTGLTEMQYLISDRWETPAGTERHYTETLLRLPDGYVCYSPPPDAPDVSELPARDAGRITFGCFNNLAKITPRALATWAAILTRVPDAHLVLKTHQLSDPQTVARLHAIFAAHGVAASRIECRGSSTHRSQLAQHADIDIMLDPFPYSGGLTTCEALWMGVPVVTVPGEIFASRHSTSHLHNVGLADWVAGNVAEYEDIAVSRASDIASLRALRAGLRARMRASPLCNQRRFGKHLGAALRDTWREACAP